jgi:hypothetical protein
MTSRRRWDYDWRADWDGPLVEQGESFYCVFRDAVERLEKDFIPMLLDVDHGTAACLLAEAVNLAAKVLREEYYEIKPRLIDYAAAQPGVTSGWGDDGCFYLHTDTLGTVCFHDPFDQIESGGIWHHGWSGVHRQHLAFDLMLGDLDLLRMVAVETAITAPLAYAM